MIDVAAVKLEGVSSKHHSPALFEIESPGAFERARFSVTLSGAKYERASMGCSMIGAECVKEGFY